MFTREKGDGHGKNYQVIKVIAFAAVFSMLPNIFMSRDLVNLEQESVEGRMSEIIRNIFEVGAAPNISDLFLVLASFDLQHLRKKSKELFFSPVSELMKSSESMKKAREKLKREISEDAMQEYDPPRQKFLLACLKESMRLHPPSSPCLELMPSDELHHSKELSSVGECLCNWTRSRESERSIGL
ncbi:hypothetical protein SADUNF_Sadunf03G0154100 [Salix dunnii]|uniref:Uncharacterized protein n=1 Tax=Salix dunnii TaxID=1413687 RepID=A0A835N547_9ROSI|nr:hypothetical protein SADUNF_Sadunf03G0154100 [Salix dunnii]